MYVADMKPGPKPMKDRTKVRSKPIPIRLSEAEIALLRTAAEAEGKKLPEWLRDLALARAKRLTRR